MQSRTEKNTGKLINLTGKHFGKWTVVGRSEKRNTWFPFQKRWNVVCDCGNHQDIDGANLRRGEATNCGCSRNAAFRKRPYEALFHLFERAVERTARTSTITYEQFAMLAEQDSCHYCGDSVSFKKYSPRSAAYRLDRKDNSKNYSTDNVVVCCKNCNYAKGARYTYEEWIVMTKALKEHRKEEAPIVT